MPLLGKNHIITLALIIPLTACGVGSVDQNTTSSSATNSSVLQPEQLNTGQLNTAALESDWPPAIANLSSTTSCAGPLVGTHQTLEVGPGKTYLELTDVPWLSLVAGDVVNIYPRSTPYKTKFALRARGTAAAPVVINGVTDANCNRPEISGDGAVAAKDAAAANFWPSIETLGLIQIYRAPNDPDDSYQPQYITIQNLKLTGAHYSKTFTGVGGTRQNYDYFSAAVYGLRVAHLTIENCEITANGIGIFTNSRGGSPVDFSAYTIIRRNTLYANGTPRDTEHNLYIQSYRALYEGNYIGPVSGGNGSAIKDRSSGTVIRYNHIVSGARALDLVESEEEENTFVTVRKDPLYNTAWVYGNLIENDYNKNSYSTRLIHWGYDNTLSRARTGKLNFYNNTLINRSLQSNIWYTTLFHMNPEAPSSLEVEARSNVFANYGNTEYQFITEAGRVNLRGTNLAPTDWLLGQPGVTGTLDQTGSVLLTATDPFLSANYAPAAASTSVIDKGSNTLATIPPIGAIAANLQVTQQYTPGGWKVRPVNGVAPDLGAFEFDGTSPNPINTPPTLQLTNPSNNATFIAPATLTITADARDADGTITKVEFFNGNTPLGTVATAPYIFPLTLPAGNYSLKAVAYDNLGASSSATANISVGEIAPSTTNKPPTVRLTSPTNNASFPFPSKITLSAEASDADGKITKVEFFNGTVLLATDTTAPYQVKLNWPRGNYTVKAVAYDNSGASSSATANISVGVTPPPVPSGTWTTIANEFDIFSVTGTQTVRFGAGSSWLEKTFAGVGVCARDFFGGDPADGVVKVCQVQK
jgi:hypothetical protein